MPNSIPKSFKPRKTPVQERSTQTIEAIFEATIQVLLKDGIKKLTTTRVAERAGVSVGSLYQYYPNKEALLIATLEKHLELIGTAAQLACRKSYELSVDEMLDNVINAFVDTKFKKKDISLAMAELLNEVSCVPRYLEVVKQVEIELSAMFKTLPNVQPARIPFVVDMMISTMGSATKSVMDKNAPPDMVKELKHSLHIMFKALIENELLKGNQ